MAKIVKIYKSPQNFFIELRNGLTVNFVRGFLKRKKV